MFTNNAVCTALSARSKCVLHFAKLVERSFENIESFENS